MRLSRALLCLAVSILATISLASTGVIKLTTFPSISVADARSTVVVTAEVRDLNGRLVADGTQVLFETTVGAFRENVVQTVNGLARATLVAGSIPGSAKITASAFALNATSTTDFQFVADRSLLSSAKEYVEVVAPESLVYSMEHTIMVASGPGKGVHVRYRDITVDADDVQLYVPGYELKARKARLKMGSMVREFEELSLTLNTRKGFGTTTYDAKDLMIVPAGTFFRIVETDQTRLRFGPVVIDANGIRPSPDLISATTFEFTDISAAISKISAKKAIAYPRKEVQFQKADIMMGDVKVMKLPLFQVSLYGGTPLLTDQVINVDNNQLAVNYPHYLSLKPGETSLLRFRMGERYGRGLDVSKGAYLDYELNWNRGDDMEGGLTVSGLARSDWGINARQYLRIDDRTTAFAQVDMSSLRNLFASGNLSRQFDGYQVNLSGNSSTTIRGLRYANEHYSLIAEKDPMKVGKLPVRLFWGAVASHSATEGLGYTNTQTAYGIRGRAQMLPISLDKKTSINASLSVSHLMGHNTLDGLTIHASANMSHQLTRDASLLFTYDFSEDAINLAGIGKHRLSVQGSYFAGRTGISFFGSRSLDADRMNLFADASYRLSNIWRLAYSLTHDQYLGSTLQDYNLTLMYRMGWRDFGLTWSSKTHRFGIQVLGATFN